MLWRLKMDQITRNHEKLQKLNTDLNSWNSLIKLAKLGHYLLFYEQWLAEYFQNTKLLSKIKFTGKENLKINKINKAIHKYQSIDRKKTVLMALSPEDRNLFICYFLKLVDDQNNMDKQSLQ